MSKKYPRDLYIHFKIAGYGNQMSKKLKAWNVFVYILYKFIGSIFIYVRKLSQNV